MKFKRLAKPIFNKVQKLIPRNNFGDRLYSLVNFVRVQRRFPNNKKLFTNYLFQLKHSAESDNPLRAYISDKSFVKDYIKAKIGEEYNVPTIKILKSLEKIKAFEFPKRCCIKLTHMSGGVILREKAEKIDFDAIEKWFGTNYYDIGREKCYRYLTPKVIVEPLIFDKSNNEDYKFFCFNGKAKFVQVDIDRRENHTRLYFDRDWKEQEFSISKKKYSNQCVKPDNYELMLAVADELSKDFEFIRVDLYTDGKQIYVGELTNWPENGDGYFVPRSSEIKASDLLFSES